MSTQEFRLPALGDGQREATIIEWYVTPGDYVVAGQPLLAVETATALIDVPAPRSGRIATHDVAEGERVPVGAVLLRLAAASHGEGLTLADAVRDTSSTATGAPTPSAPASVRASTAARRLARELRHELESITASDANDAIDADGTMALHETAPVVWQELDAARRTMAVQMADAHEAASASVHAHARTGAWLEGTQRQQRLVRAVVHACALEPALNCWFDPERLMRCEHPTVNIGVVAGAMTGTCVSVLRDVAALDDDTLLASLQELQASASAHPSPREQADAATISLVDFGTLGVETARLAVLAPQVAMVTSGRITQAVVVRDGVPAVEPVLPLSLSFDQRAVGVGEAARFLDALREHLERAEAS